MGIIITPNQRAPYVERFTLMLVMPRLLLLTQTGMVAVFGIAIMALMALTTRSPLPANAFTMFEDIFPGQSMTALRTHGFTCWLQDYNYNDPSEARCGVNPKSGKFSHIEVVFAKGTIHQLTFEMRDYALNMGDVAVMLGLTDIQYHGVVLFRWRNHMGLARLDTPVRRFSLFRDVWTVTLTDAPFFGP